MAENKSSFILYADLMYTVDKLPNDIAGKLFKIILEYVNDKDPVIDDLLLQVLFEPIRQQLKRDLVKWNKYIDKQSENGKLGGRPKKIIPIKEKPNNPTLLLKSQKSLSVSVSVSDSVNVNDIVIKKKRAIQLPPTLIEILKYFDDNGYSQDSANKCFEYYELANWYDSRGNKVKSWKQKCMGVWFKDENLKSAITQTLSNEKSNKSSILERKKEWELNNCVL